MEAKDEQEFLSELARKLEVGSTAEPSQVLLGTRIDAISVLHAERCYPCAAHTAHPCSHPRLCIKTVTIVAMLNSPFPLWHPSNAAPPQKSSMRFLSKSATSCAPCTHCQGDAGLVFHETSCISLLFCGSHPFSPV